MKAPLAWLAAILVLVNIPMTLLVAPEAANFRAPLTQRILYYHVPAAWVAYVAFAVTAAAGAMVLWRNDRRYDAISMASAEVGTLFSIIALGTGLIWSRQEFIGYDAFQDPKVISLVVAILAYFAYFVLRSSIDERDRRAKLAAVYGILAVISVPLTYVASRNSVHPDWLRPDESLDPSLGWFLLYSVIAFTVLYAALVQLRVRLARIEESS